MSLKSTVMVLGLHEVGTLDDTERYVICYMLTNLNIVARIVRDIPKGIYQGTPIS